MSFFFREARKKIREKKYRIQIHLAKNEVNNPICDGLSSDDDEIKTEQDKFVTERSKCFLLKCKMYRLVK